MNVQPECVHEPFTIWEKKGKEILALAYKRLFDDVVLFAQYGSRIRLRSYQEEVARAVVDSVTNQLGLSIVVVFPRQSGKNELQAQIETFLLLALSKLEVEIVKASPTWKPQSLNAMHRLERVLKRNFMTQLRWKKERGYIYRIGHARAYFLSASPEASIVGATASALLEIDEAQDVQISKYDKDLAPMCASTNATRVFWGTAWTSRTLLARERRAAEEAQRRDGKRRVFVLDAKAVAAEVPAYGKFVEEQIHRLGEDHPLVLTQFFCKEIDAEGGFFPAQRRELMQGSHERAFKPVEGRIYALLVDVGGEDEASTDQQAISGQQLSNPGRDATACTIVEVDLVTLGDEVLRAPTYRVVDRRGWTGVKHARLYGQIKALAEHWQAQYIVIDATGVGAGLASFLEKALPGRVIPFLFSAKSKSDLGWSFLAVVESGRFKDHRRGRTADRRPMTDDGRGMTADRRPMTGDGRQISDDQVKSKEQAEFWRQLEFVKYEAGENKVLKWGVPDGTRDPATGELVHDDWVLSAAMCVALDAQEWGLTESVIIRGVDPLEGMREAF